MEFDFVERRAFPFGNGVLFVYYTAAASDIY